ncbi:S-adenosyl-L-methionine-dependent methyltransferase [Syncephalis plumigaleata]|nr:S-adenosyl-L-methionine-dependent methyltransferase [Syncephalis plumigaleata]
MQSDNQHSTDELNPSKLGTKDYWDQAYERELAQYEENGDMGEVWFGEDAAERMADWLVDNIVERDTPMVDLGCGNGHLLLTLAEAGFTKLTGVDYSPAAIALATALAEEREYANRIHYEPLDLLSLVNSDDSSTSNTMDHVNKWRGRFHVVLDKGTYDAISLHPDQKIARDTGLLLITSCNWTQSELEQRFDRRKQHNNESLLIYTIYYYGHVNYPKFTFGGVTGQTISTVVFKKRIGDATTESINK